MSISELHYLLISPTSFHIECFVSMQYSALRGVYGTPTFFVNGFVLPDAGSALNFSGWKTILDQLIDKKGPKKEENLHFFL